MAIENVLNVLTQLSEASVDDVLPINISSKHPLYTKNQPIWQKCRDAYDGEESIKGTYNDTTYNNMARVQEYLPKLNGQETQDYLNYLNRAHWFGATNRTVASYLGMIFRKDPAVLFDADSEEEEMVSEDFFRSISSEGKSLSEFIHEVAEEIIKVNRVGVLVDYPKNTEAKGVRWASEYEDLVKSKNIHPNLAMYTAETIVNWGWTYIDQMLIPMYFVLKEEAYNGLDSGSLSPIKTDTYRVLFLEPYEGAFRYKQVVFESIISGSQSNTIRVTDTSTPMINGEYIPFIPFYVLDDHGINFKTVRKPMINELVNTNIGHFRNSADWENELHMVGHKTIYFPGWDKKVYGNPRIGGALAGPANCEPKFLEAKSDSGIRTEMDKKVEEMAVLGAERISPQARYVASAETARVTTASESSSLTLLATSLGKSFSNICDFLLKWAGKKDTGVNIQVNKDFYQDDINGSELLDWMKAWQQGGISFETYFMNLKKKEVFPENWDAQKEKQKIQDSLNEQLSLSDEKYMEILEKFDRLEQDVQATITTSNSGATLLSVSTTGGGSNISTSTDVPEGNQEGAIARNNETRGASSASAKEDKDQGGQKERKDPDTEAGKDK